MNLFLKQLVFISDCFNPFYIHPNIMQKLRIDKSKENSGGNHCRINESRNAAQDCSCYSTSVCVLQLPWAV